MANNKTITIEHIIGKLDNDFNPDGSDWIPRVPAWCVDAMNELKVLRKVDKKMKLTVINKIAKSKCCLIDDGLKVYDSNGCEVPRKRLAWRLQPFDVLFKGDDWKDTPKGAQLEAEMAEVGARVVYLPYTPSTSSTKLRRFIAPEDFSDEASADKSDKATEGEQQ